MTASRTAYLVQIFDAADSAMSLLVGRREMRSAYKKTRVSVMRVMVVV